MAGWVGRAQSREPNGHPIPPWQTSKPLLRVRTPLTLAPLAYIKGTSPRLLPRILPTSVTGALGFISRAAAMSCNWFTSSVMDSRSSGLICSMAPAARQSDHHLYFTLATEGPDPKAIERRPCCCPMPRLTDEAVEHGVTSVISGDRVLSIHDAQPCPVLKRMLSETQQVQDAPQGLWGVGGGGTGEA